MTQVFFIDQRVQGIDLLINALPPGSSWLVIDEAIDGLSQIETYVSILSELEAIHVISHGSSGTVLLGNSILNCIRSGVGTAHYELQVC